MNKKQDLIIIGGGIMGLMTAYFASRENLRVTILEKSFVGNKQAASFSLTRSFRCDYIDPLYANLASEARKLWLELEKKSEEDFFIPCKLLNLVRKDITPNLSETYGAKSYSTLKKLGLPTKKLTGKLLKQEYPQFEADYGYLDESGGVLYLPAITKMLLKQLKSKGVLLVENIDVLSIEEVDQEVTVVTNSGIFKSSKLVISSGMWTNNVLKLVKGRPVQFPITLERPSECKYYIPSKAKMEMFSWQSLPILPYLDVGIYGHPILVGRTPGVKISYYNPPDIQRQENTRIQSVQDFVNICMPSLKDAKVLDVEDVDQCSYDMVADKNFIIGKLPKFERIFVGTGWNGTGYKFAPLIGKILSSLVKGEKAVYDISRFSPARFEQVYREPRPAEIEIEGVFE